MKKSILNLGKALNKADQKNINGGKIAAAFPCYCNGTLLGDKDTVQDCWDAC